MLYLLSCLINAVFIIGDDLKKWLSAMRTRFGKLKMKLEGKSGMCAADVALTDREKWLWTTFQFLKPFMAHHKDGKSKGVSSIY